MTRLFGCISNQPQRLGEALAPARGALVARGPLSRWGVGYVHSGEVLLSQHPLTVSIDELNSSPKGVRGPTAAARILPDAPPIPALHADARRDILSARSATDRERIGDPTLRLAGGE